jgi:hypothetical protein
MKEIFAHLQVLGGVTFARQTVQKQPYVLTAATQQAGWRLTEVMLPHL